jgi:hypothetical protein
MEKNIYVPFAPVLILFGLLLILTGCPDIFEPPVAPNAPKAGVRITVSDGSTTERTLLPKTGVPTIDHYILVFVDSSSPSATHGNFTIDSGETAVLEDLDDGNWTITANGYDSNDKLVASGEGELPSYSGGNASLIIKIYPVMTAGVEGTFTYNVTVPADTTTATLNISPFPNGTSTDRNLLATGNNAASIPLSPGYYLMVVRLAKNDGSYATDTQIVHIYSDMETKYEKVFVPADFSEWRTITAVATDNIAHPLMYNTPQTSLTVPVGSNYNTAGTISWYNNGTNAPHTWAFESETVYRAEFILTAATGYTFTGFTGTLRYKGATSVTTSVGGVNGSSLTVTVVFAETCIFGDYQVDLSPATTTVRNDTAWITSFNSGFVIPFGPNFDVTNYDSFTMVYKMYANDGTTEVASGSAGNSFQMKYHAVEVADANGADVGTTWQIGGTNILSGDKFPFTSMPQAAQDAANLWGFGIQSGEGNNGTKADFFEVISIVFHLKPGSIKTLDSIDVTNPPDKITYTVGETLDLTGLEVTATYEDTTTAVVTPSVISPAEGTMLNTAGTITVTVHYTEWGLTMTTSFEITVTAVINIAAIAGVTAPVAGVAPVTAITETAQYTGTVTWEPDHTTFAAGQVYTATITLTAKTGYTLTGVAANYFTVAGTSTPATNAANTGVITAVFPATDPPGDVDVTLEFKQRDETFNLGTVNKTTGSIIVGVTGISDGASIYGWIIDGGAVEVDSTNPQTIYFAYLKSPIAGSHMITVIVEKDGTYYSMNLSFDLE